MTQYIFGAGYVLGKRTDVANTQPAFFGTTQEWSFDIDQKLVKLIGQFKDPVDVAPSERDITGKIKFARMQATMFGNMLLGVTPTASSGFDLIGPEAITPGTTSFTVASGATFSEDLGVFYHSTGVALTPVAAAPAAGQYVAGLAGVGTYTINVADEVALDVFYQVTTTSQFKIVLPSQLMGSGPVCELNFSVPYTVGGVAKKFNLQFPAVRFGKTPMNFKNAAYMIPEMDFTCFANSAGNVLTWSMTE